MSTRAAVAIALSMGVVACGGGEEDRQDADEPSGTFEVEVVDAEFPERQRLARAERLVLEVRNSGDRAIPNLAATVTGFESRDEEADQSSEARPTWIIDEGPRGGQTAYVATWALGALRPGQSKRFVWRVTAVRAGEHEVRWRIAAGLDGSARAVESGGGTPEGRFDVRVEPQAAQSRVDPETGEVERITPSQ